MININKIYLLVLVVALMIICSSCSQSDNTQKIDYSRFLEDQNSVINEKSQTNKSAGINTPAPTGKMTEENAVTTADKAQDETLAWNWPSDMDFTGVKSEMKDFKLGNLSSNIKINASASCLLCPDTQNNTIYYMSRKDRFIYKQEGDKSTLLVEMQAHNLQLWDNKLYFINIKKTNYYASGPIYSYDLETKELKLVLDKNIALFNIDNYGIYYSELGDSMQLKVNLLDFNNKITSLDDYPWVISYNEYLLTVLDGNLSLINRNTDDIISIMHFEDAIQIPSLHIYKDKLIFAVETCVYVLDLITGDKKSYNAKEVYPLLEKIEDSAFIDNNIYASYGSKDLIRIDLNKDEIRGYVFIDNRTDTYSYLQTDGERLFASVYQLDPATFKITATGYDELFIPPSGNELTRKEFGQ